MLPFVCNCQPVSVCRSIPIGREGLRRKSLVPTRKIASFLGTLPFSVVALSACSALDLGFLTGSGNETAGYDRDSRMGQQLLDQQKF